MFLNIQYLAASLFIWLGTLLALALYVASGAYLLFPWKRGTAERYLATPLLKFSRLDMCSARGAADKEPTLMLLSRCCRFTPTFVAKGEKNTDTARF